MSRQQIADETSFLGHSSTDVVAISDGFTEFEEIATGTFCLVMRAKKSGQWFVIKALKEKYRESTQHIALLKKEYEIMSMFDSPYVVKVYDFCQIEGYGMCIVMEWIDGKTLKDWLTPPDADGESLRPNRAERLRVAKQLLCAVAYVHSHQAVHRDLKPSNIMITRNGGQVKLIDFGLSDTDSFAIFKQSAGTSGFISPEQRLGKGTDERNDIYSLGVIMGMMRLGLRYKPVIRKCLAPIGSRYKTVADMAKAIQRIRQTAIAAVLVPLMVLLGMGGYLAYDSIFSPRPHYDVVARFQYSNIIYESWGGGLVTARAANNDEHTVEVPQSVENEGFRYKVDEITFNAFRGDKTLRTVIIPPSVHIMRGAFRRCPNLSDIYVKGQMPPTIGNKLWPADINQIFDDEQFARVRLHIPKGFRANYMDSPWKRFAHIVEYD